MRRAKRPSLAADQRGATQTEYTVVLVLVALAAVAALAAIAVPVLHYHESLEQRVLSTVP